jgi:hypothetical protein
MICAGASKFLKRQITVGRLLLVVYVALVVIACGYVAESRTSAFHKAARELGANTRLTETDLRELPVTSNRDRLRLKRARDKLIGQYLARDVHRDEAIDADSVLAWPDLKDVATTPVPLGAEPDQRMLNQGSSIDVAIGDSHKQLQVLAVVTSDGKWFALVRKSEIGDISSQEPKLGRILSLPGAAVAQAPPVPKKSAPPTGKGQGGRHRREK